MSTRAQYPRSDTQREKTVVHAEAPFDGRKLLERCGEHGERLTELEDVADLTVHRGDVSYHLKHPERTAIGYCEACLATLRTRNLDYRDMTARELVVDRMKRNFRGDPRTGQGGFADLFEPASVAVGDGLANCPYCGGDLEILNAHTGRCICPEHGELTVNVRQHDADP